MSIGTRLFLALLASLCVALPLGAQRLADHVVLISVDGFRPDFYRDSSWPTPNIQRLAEEGSFAERARGVFPSVTYPSHTTIITGALPARHGIYYNTPFEPGGQTGRWYWEYASVAVPSLWQAVTEAGGESAAFSWPVTVGAPIRWLVPEVWALEGDDRLGPMRQHSRPPGIFEELEREATGRLTLRTFGADWISRDDESGQAAAYLLETYRPMLLAVHLIASDHFQHESGRDSLDARLAVAAADRAIGAIYEAAQRAGILERTAFVVTGDHGFVNTHTELAPNTWLVEAGLMEATPDRGEWRATFHSSAGSVALVLRDPADREAADRVRAVIDDLPASKRNRFRVVEREELDAIGADPSVPFALSARLGVRFTASASGPDVRSASGGTHGYHPADFPEIYTGFVAWGSGVVPGVVVHEIGLEDIAPLIASLLALDFEAPDGLAPLGLLAARAD